MNINEAIPANSIPKSIPCFSNPQQLNKWLFEEIKPYIHRRVMEINSGLGLFSSLLIENQIPIHLSDVEEKFRDALHTKFGNTETIRKIHNLNPGHPEFEKTYPSKLGIFGTVIALNITDHCPIDLSSINNLKLLLRERGRLIILRTVQSIPYDSFNQSLDDLKQTNWPTIKKLLNTDLDFMKARYFNLLVDKYERVFNQTGLFMFIIGRKNNK